ncbi:MAG: hypothetical protein IVW54_17785 [Candidatus Binataceae bacterium]|nr:hypothetical protein [Candidatus Binataceae bacterium]
MIERNASKAAEEGFQTANDYAEAGADAAREYAGRGYDSAREYADRGLDVAAAVSENMREFVRREPWLAVAAAFAVGYTLARLMRRMAI